MAPSMTQAHRTVTDNGEPNHPHGHDPKPETTPHGDAATPGTAPAVVERHWLDRDSGGELRYTASSGVSSQPGSAGDTTATGCGIHVTFGGEGEPVEYHCPTGFAPGGGYLLDDGRVLHRQDTAAGTRTHRPPAPAHTPARLQDAPGTPSLPQPVVLAATSAEQAHAALFTASVWQAITHTQSPRPTTMAHAHLPRMFDPAWLAQLPTPTRHAIPGGLSVTLGGGGFHRYPDHAAMLAAHRQQPRTWIFENTHRAIPWISLAAAYLGKLSASPLEVIAAVFDSQPHEQAPALHTDQWYSVIVQLDGAKTWTIGTGPHPHRLTTEPGDLLLIPEALAHAAATPPDPGHSRHLTFALYRHTTHTTATPQQPR